MPMSSPSIAARLNKDKLVRTCTAISYVNSDLEGRNPVVVRYNGSLFSSSLLIVGSDQSIFPIFFYKTYNKRNLPSRIDTSKTVRLVHHKKL
jgi:hypothetical protein